MAVHYFTLKALSLELDEMLRNLRIVDVFSQQKNELCLTFSGSDVPSTLCLSVEPGLNYCVLREKFTRAKSNSVDLFQPILERMVLHVSIHPTDRVMFFETDNHFQLCAQLYNTAASNIVLTNHDMVIVESFKREKALTGQTLTINNRGNGIITPDILTFESRAKELPGKTTLEYLKHILPVFGALYSREILYRTGIDEQCLAEQLTTSQILNIHGTIERVLEECNHARPTTYQNENKPDVFSIIPLQSWQGVPSLTFQSVNEAVQTFLSKKFRQNNFEEKKKELYNKLHHACQQLERTVRTIKNEITSAERSAEYEHIGHTIMANLHAISKGEPTIQFPDIFDEQIQLTIHLDPSQTAYNNAERYFEKARKAKAARSEAEERLQNEERKQVLLQSSLAELAVCTTVDDLKEYLKHHEPMVVRVSKQGNEDRIPFRVFTVAGGYEVWVGKSSANNDLLTTKYAKPNDLWFHARGAGGSHTVLKIPEGKSAPPHEAIIQTARIAAYYSKMRKAGNVPVAYCERKYIRKPKHAPEGAVFLEREEVLYVEPRLP